MKIIFFIASTRETYPLYMLISLTKLGETQMIGFCLTYFIQREHGREGACEFPVMIPEFSATIAQLTVNI